MLKEVQFVVSIKLSFVTVCFITQAYRWALWTCMGIIWSRQGKCVKALMFNKANNYI